METALEKIRAKCIEANPEIAALKFGSRLQPKDYSQWKWVERGEIARVLYPYEALGEAKVAWDDSRISTERIEDFTIIGCPIRLADVLLAIGVSPQVHGVTVDIYGEYLTIFWVRKEDARPYLAKSRWNLREDDLEKQSPETVEFIGKVLGV